jgi:hypothetical protein
MENRVFPNIHPFPIAFYKLLKQVECKDFIEASLLIVEGK